MILQSVNIGTEQPIQNGKKTGTTGIYKIPTEAPVQVTRLGLIGDAIIDTENHGGYDQAVYVFGSLDYDWWSAELGQPLAPGTFGENLTVRGLESAPLQIGDRLSVGAVLLEVTAPRIPCVTLAVRMGDPTFVKRFRKAERPGVYCRVIVEGELRVGDPVSVAPYSGATITARELFRAYYDADTDEEVLLRILAAPIDERGKPFYEERLAEQREKAPSER